MLCKGMCVPLACLPGSASHREELGATGLVYIPTYNSSSPLHSSSCVQLMMRTFGSARLRPF